MRQFLLCLLAAAILSQCRTIVDVQAPLPGSALYPIRVSGSQGALLYLQKLTGLGARARFQESVQGLEQRYLDCYSVSNPRAEDRKDGFLERFIDERRENPDIPAYYAIYLDIYATETESILPFFLPEKPVLNREPERRQPERD